MDAACGIDCGACPTVTIDFDDLMDDALVTDQYGEWVRFSTAPGFQLRTNNAAHLLGGSQPNILSGYADDSGQNNVNVDVVLEFVSPVSALRLIAVGINTPVGEKCATLEIEDEVAGSVRRDLTTQPDDPAAFQSTYSMIDLGELTRVTRFAIVEMNDPFGFGVNDISFTVHPGL
jgi:hypothetical protein